MPLGFQRLNERHQRPNEYINFIKPQETPDKAIAEDFLERIAAQCYPILKKYHISVMSLEEYEPNPEFLGRNFNAGEVIQLVLKDKQGRWLSFNFVQMVMMHELAHCKQMNHSRFFWNVRNEYAKQMEGLWREGYLGEGIWGRGRGLDSGSFIHAAAPNASQIPEHLCGGTYRRRGRKRKRGSRGADNGPMKLSYAERQQRRIARKFGVHGEGASLGENELLRGALETMNGGKRGQGKPKVANSKRGRELRANAALARFEQVKSAPPTHTPEPEQLDSETESEWEDDIHDSPNKGRVLRDRHGHDLIRVCGDEAEDDEDGAGQEMSQLGVIGYQARTETVNDSSAANVHDSEGAVKVEQKTETETHETTGSIERLAKNPSITLKDSETESEPEQDLRLRAQSVHQKDAIEPIAELAKPHASSPLGQPRQKSEFNNKLSKADGAVSHAGPALTNSSAAAEEIVDLTASDPSQCPICSLENDSSSPTCIACSHVLQPGLIRNCWRCKSDACKGTKFINSGDVGRCGVCGAQRTKTSGAEGMNGRSVGVLNAEVLRWD